MRVSMLTQAKCERFYVILKRKTKQLHLLSHDSLGQRVPSPQQSRVRFFRFIRLHCATKTGIVALFTNSILALCHHHFFHCTATKWIRIFLPIQYVVEVLLIQLLLPAIK